MPFRLEVAIESTPRRQLADEQWRAVGTSRREHAAEQDRAAGGPERRLVRTENGRVAQGSVWFKRVNCSVYAYLRYSVGATTRARYIGPVASNTREKALEEAWSAVHDRALEESPSAI